MTARERSNQVYQYADKATHRMNRRNLRAFDRLKQTHDELNLVREIGETYRQSAEYAVGEYVAIAVRAFTEAQEMCGISHGVAVALARKYMTADWVMDVLSETDPVTMYQFEPEMDRKSQRLSEAVTIPEKRQIEIERALRYWTTQVSQYAITIVDRAMIAGFMTAGITKVRWNTEGDSAVCNICDKLDGRVFSITKVPPKQHYHCRCWLTPHLH